jgi:small subunit ribosomal protein S3
MSHTVHPFSHRLGVIRDWRSRWFATGEKYRDFLKADTLLREFLVKKLRNFYIGGIEIERSPRSTRIIIKTARPGMLIGRGGDGVAKLRSIILKEAKRLKIPAMNEIKVDIEEIKSPEGNASVVAAMIAESLEKRLPFRRVMKQMLEKVMANRDVLGVKIYLGGRLGGADMARSEEMKKGRIPLQTFRADIDFARDRAHLTYGDIGIKVWIYKGEIFTDQSRK